MGGDPVAFLVEGVAFQRGPGTVGDADQTGHGVIIEIAGPRRLGNPRDIAAIVVLIGEGAQGRAKRRRLAAGDAVDAVGDCSQATAAAGHARGGVIGVAGLQAVRQPQDG